MITFRRSGLALVLSSFARTVLGAGMLLVLVSVLPAVAGWQTTVVMSGSMEPTLSPGDVTLVRPVDPADLQPGQIVLVDDPDRPGQLRVHRLVGIEDGGLRLRGDANPREDSSLVAISAVHGTGAARLPGLGLPAVWLAEHRVLPLAGTAAALVALLGLAFLHRGTEATNVPGDDAGTPPGGRRGRGRRAAALGTAVLALAVPAVTSGAQATFTAVTSNPTSTFASAQYWSCASALGTSGANATLYHPLQESSGTTAVNQGTSGAAGAGTYSSTGITYRTAGPTCASGVGSAVTLDGISGQIWSSQLMTNPQQFSVQTWFNTTTTTGGKLIGFGNGTGGAASGQYDRHVYMTDAGNLVFGLYNGGQYVITSPGTYNDGQWHLVTATFSAGPGMRLYVDGVLLGKNQAVNAAETTTGTWRIGYDTIGPGWPGAPTSAWFAGSLAHAAVFTTALSAAEVTAQYGAGPLTCSAETGPGGTAAPRYWPLQERAGSTATNQGTAGTAANATFSSGGVSYNETGPLCGTGQSAAVRLDGASGQLWTTQPVTNPQVFSEAIWFSTTTTSGGKLIGFGSGANGSSSSQFDRHIFMTSGGQLSFGVYDGSCRAITSPAAYNDGAWHLATATFSATTGMNLYVDGGLVAGDATVTVAENYTGYWRIGYDNLNVWPAAPASYWFAGKVAHASVYDRVLSVAEIRALAFAGS